MILFSNVLVVANAVYLPCRDPAIPNTSGGYVTSNRHTL